MSGWFACAKFPLNLDLNVVDRVLTERNIVHRFTEEQGHQLLWLFEPNDRSVVVELLNQWRHNGLSNHKGDIIVASESHYLAQVAMAITAAPAAFIVIVLGILGALIANYADHGHMQILSLLNFFPFAPHDTHYVFFSAKEAIIRGQVWRLLTPTFIHFGALHIVFNALWIWIFGQKIERILGSAAFILIFLATALFANIVQAVWYGAGVFGGLSGVVYGLMGFIWIWQSRLPGTVLKIPTGIVAFMVVWLVLGFIGGVDFIMGKSIANGAHFGGLIAGVTAGFYATQRVIWRTQKSNLE